MATGDTQYVIEGSLYLDRDATQLILTPIGPFDSTEEAEEFMWKMRPYHGSWSVVPLYTALQSAQHVEREAAANFLVAKANIQKTFTQRLDEVIGELMDLWRNSSPAFRNTIEKDILENLTKIDSPTEE